MGFIVPTYLHYLISITIWSTTWYAITLQLGVVDPLVSVTYRFLLASGVLLGWCWIKGYNLKFKKKDLFVLFIKGITLYSLSYFATYTAMKYITSGVNAVVSSTIIFFNILNAYAFLKEKFELSVVTAGLIGISGIILMFLPEFQDTHIDIPTIKGLGYAVLAAFLSSLGNIASAKSQKKGINVMVANAISMGFGGLFSLLIVMILGIPLTFDSSPAYGISLFYLSIFGSIFAFGSYLSLVGRVGPARAAHPLLLVPVFALIISAFFEDYEWSLYAVLGIVLILGGNILASYYRAEKSIALKAGVSAR